ncbi:Phenylpyruvate decarboxylase [Fusarium falciforme]|nr:Phenylpyruvate decarboxylase [Fusarium falciforme]
MTIQELSTILKCNIPLEVIIWNNNGYTIERAIMGPTRSYNDVMSWKWTKLFEAFGDFDGKYTNSTLIQCPLN